MSKNISADRTMAIVLGELNATVNAFNEAEATETRVELSAKSEALVKEYNALSLLHSYANFLKADAPLVELAKAYYYDVVKTEDKSHEYVIDGVKKSKLMRSVKDGLKRLDVVKFIEWTAERNKSIAANVDWRSKTEAARATVIEEWKKYFAAGGDTHAISNGKIKRAVQAMFDSLVFIKADSGLNAIIATGNIAKWVFSMACERKDSKVDNVVNIDGFVMAKSRWNTLLLDILHKAVIGKDFGIFFGDEVPEDDKPEAEAEKTDEAKKPETADKKGTGKKNTGKKSPAKKDAADAKSAK